MHVSSSTRSNIKYPYQLPDIPISYQPPTIFDIFDMTSPILNTQASALQEHGDETSKNKLKIVQPGPDQSSTPSSETPPNRHSLKRKHSGNQSPQPRLALSRLMASPRESQEWILVAQADAVADNAKLGSAEENDLSSEQSLLMDENIATLGRFSDPKTPPNRPWLLTEDGLLMSLPAFEDSESEQDLAERRGDPLKEELGFGDWLPGHGPWVSSPSALGPRHERREASPSDRIIRRRRGGTLGEEFGFGNRLLGHPQVCNPLSLVSGQDDQREVQVAAMMKWDWPTGSLERQDARPAETQRSERVEGEVFGSSSRPTRPWEL